MATVELRGLRRTFGNIVALDHLDLDMPPASSSPCSGRAAVGRRRRCGSSRALSGRTPGEVLVDGKDVLGQPANKRNMGMVFQAYSLFPNMTAQQNVEFGLRVRKQHHDERAKRARELLDLVGLGSAMSRYPRQLSGGQQQRVALARSLAIQPRRAPPRRAALRARRQGARAAPRGGPPDPARARHHDAVRHPRPGGGAFDLRPGGRHVGWQGGAARDAGADLQRSADRLRGELRRHDEQAGGASCPPSTRRSAAVRSF